ncbi:MAG: hypothetical protein H0T73_15675 [Ardenticatenales bacterium]|nr:hypothetical protein [Ardenticatenales bacterium]
MAPLLQTLLGHPVTDQVFGFLDHDHQVQRVAGGNESEVYCTDDHQFVIKIKGELAGSTDTALAHAQTMRQAATEFAACLGETYSIPTYFVIARDNAGESQVVIIQPYVHHARPLAEADYAQLSGEGRAEIARQLSDIIKRAVGCYRDRGRMPDLYGRKSRTPEERKRLNAPSMIFWRIWSFLVQRTLLRSQNLMMGEIYPHPIVLVDYDPVRQSNLYQWLYYLIRWMLFWRDRLLIQTLAQDKDS